MNVKTEDAAKRDLSDNVVYTSRCLFVTLVISVFWWSSRISTDRADVFFLRAV